MPRTAQASVGVPAWGSVHVGGVCLRGAPGVLLQGELSLSLSLSLCLSVSDSDLAYCYKDDTTVRHIRNDSTAEELRFSHLTENYLVAGRSDPNCLLPLGALRRLVSEQLLGAIGGPAGVLSCMGGIYSVRRVQQELVPAIVSAFKQHEVDAALLVPM